MTMNGDTPTFVTLGRDRLLESATIVSMGVTAGAFYYPRAPGQSALPLIVLERTSTTAERGGTSSYTVNGELSGVIAVDARVVTDGMLEQYADQIAGELMELITDGLFLHRVTFGRSGAPSAGFWAGSDNGQPEDTLHGIRTMSFTLEWGDA